MNEIKRLKVRDTFLDGASTNKLMHALQHMEEEPFYSTLLPILPLVVCHRTLRERCKRHLLTGCYILLTSNDHNAKACKQFN